ncbi:MAG: isoprenylcysteine carboxylmethyltransferase family protein [Terracidiphilus sp.]
MKLNFGTLALGVVALLFIVWRFWELPWTPLRIVGLVLAISAFLLLVLARVQLGKAFSVEAKATILVTTGLYSRIRNPIYILSSLMFVGLFLWTNMPWGLLCFLVLIPMQVFRSRKEEQILTEKFGAAYLEYKRQTWF